MTVSSLKRLNRTLSEYADEWDSLNARLFDRHPMLDSRFVDPLLKYFGNGTECLCAIRADGSLSGMSIIKPRGYGVWTTFLPAQTQIGPVLVSDSEVAFECLIGLPGLPVQLDFLCLDSAYQLRKPDGNGNFESADHALTMNVVLNGGFAAYWASRSKNLVHNMARYGRRLKGDGLSPRLMCLTAPTEVDAGVERYALLESKGWKGKAGTALERGGEQAEFYAEMMSRFAKSGDAMVFELWFDNQLAASRLIISNDNMMIILKTTYDEALRQYAPSRMLLYEVIQYAFANKAGGTLEFYTDATTDQLSWATGHRWVKHLTVYRSEFAAHTIKAGKYFRQSFGKQLSVADVSGYSIECFSHPDDFPPEVSRLFDEAEREGIEVGKVWYKNLIQTVYAEDVGVYFYVLKKGGLPVAILPVRITRNSASPTLESLSNYYSSIYSPVFSISLKARDLVPLFDTVRNEHGSVSVIRFAPMATDSRSYEVLRDALQLSGYIPFSFFCFGNWYLKVLGEWSGYWSNREGILRNTVRRMERKFQKEGGVIEMVVGGAEIEPAIQAFQQVYSASWKRPEPYPEFVPGLVRVCAEKGWLRLGIARLNGVPVAAELWIVAHGKAEIYKLAYHEDYKAYSPGKLLTAFLMRHVIEVDRVKEVDYLIGDDPHKQFWMSHRRERWGIVAYNPKTLMGALGLLREVLGRLAKNFFPGVRGRLSAKNVD